MIRKGDRNCQRVLLDPCFNIRSVRCSLAALEVQQFVTGVHSDKYQIEHTYLKQKILKMRGHLNEKIRIHIYSQVSKNILLERCRLFENFLLLSCDIKSEVDFTSTMELVSLISPISSVNTENTGFFSQFASFKDMPDEFRLCFETGNW